MVFKYSSLKNISYNNLNEGGLKVVKTVNKNILEYLSSLNLIKTELIEDERSNFLGD